MAWSNKVVSLFFEMTFSIFDRIFSWDSLCPTLLQFVVHFQIIRMVKSRKICNNFCNDIIGRIKFYWRQTFFHLGETGSSPMELNLESRGSPTSWNHDSINFAFTSAEFGTITMQNMHLYQSLQLSRMKELTSSFMVETLYW